MSPIAKRLHRLCMTHYQMAGNLQWHTHSSNLDEAVLHMAVLHTCLTTAASQHFHWDASSYQMDTSCRGYQDRDTLRVAASYAAVLDDHLDSKQTDLNNKNNNNRFMALCPGLPGWASTRRNAHPPTILIIIQSLPASSIYYNPQYPPFKFCAWKPFCTTSFHILFGVPLRLEASTSYSIHFFTQSVSSLHNTYLYHCNLFCSSINIISSIPSLSLNFLLGTLSFTLTLHIHMTILISARRRANLNKCSK